MKRENYFTYLDPNKQLRPKISKAKITKLAGWDLAWELLEPIDIASSKKSEVQLFKRLSPGQKALYFFWYLDAQVTNGGFIQFYYNGFDHYLPSILEGLALIGDKKMATLVETAEKEYHKNKNYFTKARTTTAFSKLYEKLNSFEKLDDQYYKLHDKTINLFEKYIRKNLSEFIVST